MSYNLVKTDGTPLATVADGGYNATASSLVLIGKNYAGYGTFLNENFIKLLENFSNTTAPLYPLVGQLWWRSDLRVLQVYDRYGNWKTISGAQAQADTPSNPVQGDLWFDSVNQQLKTYTGSAWLVIGPSFTSTTGTSGAVADTIVDNSQFPHVVVKFYVQNSLVAILSKDATFTPNTQIAGFPVIKPGFNLSQATSVPLLYYENANNAAYLGGNPASLYLTSTNPVVTSPLIINNPLGLSIQEPGGTVKDFDLTVGGGYVNLISQVRRNGLKIRTAPDNNNGTVIDVLVVDQTTGLVTVSGDPTAPTGVATKGYVDACVAVINNTIGTNVINLNSSIATLTANTTVVYGNVRLIQNDLGYNNPTAVPTIGGLASAAYTKITTGDTFAGNLLTLWANVAAIHSNVLSSTGRVDVLNPQRNSLYSNVRALQNSIDNIGTTALLRSGTSTVTGTLYPDTANSYDFGTSGAFFKVIYGNAVSTGSIIHRGDNNTGDIGQPNNRFGTAWMGNVSAWNGTSYFDDIVANSISIGTGVAGDNTISLHAIGHTDPPNDGNIGSAASPFGTVFHTGLSTGAAANPATVTGTYTLSSGSKFQATYADLGEYYRADAAYRPGTVLTIGGSAEVTAEVQEASDEVFGVVSTNPAYSMNIPETVTELDVVVAITGRVPVRVVGPVSKGQRLVSAGEGVARAAKAGEATPFNVIGRALANKESAEEGLVECVVQVK